MVSSKNPQWWASAAHVFKYVVTNGQSSIYARATLLMTPV